MASEESVFEEGVRVIMDHRWAILDSVSCRGEDSDAIDERIRKAKDLGGEVALLQLVVPKDEFDSMTTEACKRSLIILDTLQQGGEANG